VKYILPPFIPTLIALIFPAATRSLTDREHSLTSFAASLVVSNSITASVVALLRRLPPETFLVKYLHAVESMLQDLLQLFQIPPQLVASVPDGFGERPYGPSTQIYDALC
jgi:hypothetical protein